MWPLKRKDREPPGNPDEGTFQQVLSILDPIDVQALGGLPAEAIAGFIGTASKNPDTLNAVPAEPFSESQFRPNPAFSAFMHHVIRTYGHQDGELKEAAERQGEGFVYIIDLRTPEGPMGRVPPEDIVGAFAVEGGQLCDYEPNDKHLAFSRNGLVQLPPSLAEIHVRELKRLKVACQPITTVQHDAPDRGMHSARKPGLG